MAPFPELKWLVVEAIHIELDTDSYDCEHPMANV